MTEPQTLTTKKQVRFNNQNGYFSAAYFCSDGRLPYSTGVKFKENLMELAPRDQKRLDTIKELIEKYAATYALHDTPILKGELKKYLDTKLKPAKVKEESTRPKKLNRKVAQSNFIVVHEEMIKGMRNGEILKSDGGRYSTKSIEQYERMRDRWVECEAVLKDDPENRIRLSYELTAADCKKMLVLYTKLGYSKNSIYDIFNNLKIYLKWSYNQGFHECKNYENISRELKLRPEKSDNIAPTFAEIKELYEYKFDNPNFERARDFFVLGCFLALRAEDMTRINQYHLIKDHTGFHYFEVFTQKRQKRVMIPAHWIAIKIYNKYRVDMKLCDDERRLSKQWRKRYIRGELPILTKNSLSYYLPKICKNIITGKKLTAMTKGGIKKEEYYERYQLISPHTMRRFFITWMMIDLNKTPAQVMQFTGHDSIDSFMRYIKVEAQNNLKDVALSDAFVGPSVSSSGHDAEE